MMKGFMEGVLMMKEMDKPSEEGLADFGLWFWFFGLVSYQNLLGMGTCVHLGIKGGQGSSELVPR